MQYGDENVWKESSVLSSCSNFYKYTVLWGVFFSCINFLYKFLFVKLFPNAMNKLSEPKKVEVSSYMTSLTHHIIVVPFALYRIVVDTSRTSDECNTINYASENSMIVPYLFGYFLGDTITYAIPAALQGQFDFLAHHVASIFLLIGAVTLTGHPVRFVTHMLLTEFSGLIFAITYILRVIDETSPMIQYLEILFAVVFFLTRNINMPLVMWTIRHELQAQLGYAIWVAVVPVCVLQYFWLAKILKRALKSSSSSKKKM